MEALAFGIAGLLRAEAGVEIRSRSAGVLTSLAVGVSCSCRSLMAQTGAETFAVLAGGTGPARLQHGRGPRPQPARRHVLSEHGMGQRSGRRRAPAVLREWRVEAGVPGREGIGGALRGCGAGGGDAAAVAAAPGGPRRAAGEAHVLVAHGALQGLTRQDEKSLKKDCGARSCSIFSLSHKPSRTTAHWFHPRNSQTGHAA